MTDSLQVALQQSVEEVLEKMFFIRPPDDEADTSRVPEAELAAHLTFEGEPSGSLSLRITCNVAKSICADFLGADEGEVTKEQVSEVLCELANMICGSVLSRVESAVSFRLAAPQLVDARGSIEETGQPGHTAIHRAEICGGSLTAVIRTEAPVCSTAKRYVY